MSTTDLTIDLDKAILSRLLKNLGHVDPTGASPYVGVHFEDPTQLHLYRSSMNSVIHTVGSPDIKDPDWVFCSLPHFMDSLRVIQGEQVRVERKKGFIHLCEISDIYETDLRLHSVDRLQSGLKSHDMGTPLMDIDPSWFQDFDARPFALISPPVFKDEYVMLPTLTGVVLYKGPTKLSPAYSPRDAFLRGVSGVESLYIRVTDKGYYTLEGEGVHISVSGHQVGSSLIQNYITPGKSLSVLPTKRLLYALRSSTVMGENLITFHPESGVSARDKYGNPAVFSLGLPKQTWTKFSMSVKTARTICDALSQSSDETTVLYKMEHIKTADMYRLESGAWSITFGVGR